VSLKSNAEGLLDKEAILKYCQEGDVAGLMVTNPNTLGLFEKENPNDMQNHARSRRSCVLRTAQEDECNGWISTRAW
jgi:hypothetical protein